VAVAVVALTACGAGSKRLNQAEFEAKVHALCSEYTGRARGEIDVEGADPDSPSPLALAKFSRGIEHGAQLLAEQGDALRKLHPPVQTAAEFERILAVQAQLVDAYSRAGRAARRGDRAGVKTIGREVERLYQRVFSTPLGRLTLECQ